MSFFFRLCPQDSHTCADKSCLAGMQEVCSLRDGVKVAPKDQAKPDVFDVALDKMIGRALGFYYDYGDWSL